MANVLHKTCSRCKLEKPAADFRRDKRASTGLSPSCRGCENARKLELRALNPELWREKWRKYYHENREQHARNNAAIYARHRDRILERGRKRWREIHGEPRPPQGTSKTLPPEVRAKYRRDLYAANPEPRRLHNRNRAAIRRAATKAGMTAEALRDWVNGQPKRCYWCGCKCSDRFHIDHYVPLSKGGGHELGNLVIACPPCNLSKSDKDPFDFAREVGRLM